MRTPKSSHGNLPRYTDHTPDIEPCHANLTDPIFTNETKARAFLERKRWPDGPYCPHCGEIENVTKMRGKAHRPGLYNCKSCRKQFSVTVGTVFERSKVPLNKWLLATFLLAASKKGMSAHQIHRTLGVTYKTAWFTPPWQWRRQR